MAKWTKNNYSRGEIDRAGEVLGQGLGSVELESYLQAYRVMDVWRASHAFPLNTIQVSLRRRSKTIEKSAEVVQRLKRAPSVIAKLRRNRSMKLSRVQDLGGCRSIVTDIESIKEIREIYRGARDRHSLAGEKNYLEEPRPSGYRGLHLIYRYQSDRQADFNDHRIEIQLRTRVQHAWATAVEIAGIFVRSPLKSSIGPEQWLEFFKLSSSALSLIEKAPRLHFDLGESAVIAHLRDLDQELGARSRLSQFSIANQVIKDSRSKRDTHFILRLNLEENTVTISSYSNYILATKEYAVAEERSLGDPNVDVVLVSADSIDSLTVAYPNYFADTREFISLLSPFMDR